MTQSSQPFSVRARRAQSRPLQTENFDEETKIRLKKVITPTFSQMGGDAKALVDGFFTVDPDGVKWQGSFDFEPACWVVPLRREENIIYVTYDENLPIDGDADSEHIDWRYAIRQTLGHLLGGDNWPMAFDLCEFLLAKHDGFIKEEQHRVESAERMKLARFGFPTESLHKIPMPMDPKICEAKELRESTIRKTNETLERMNVGYRLREQTGRFDSIISSASGAVNDVLSLSADSVVRKQMTQAVAAFGPHSGGDYGTAAHKAMSAAWAAVEICTGEKKFGIGIQQLKKSEKLHPALAKALGSLYGFTSQDGKGMRHPEFEGESPPDMATARFVVEICASFIAYMAEIYPDKFERKREKNRSEDIPF